VNLETPPLHDPLFSEEEAVCVQQELANLQTQALARNASSSNGSLSNIALLSALTASFLATAAAALTCSGPSTRFFPPPALCSDEDMRSTAAQRPRISLDSWARKYWVDDEIICKLQKHRFSRLHAITWTKDNILHEVVKLGVGKIGTVRNSILQWL
jgi:hypothetical protein